MQGKNMDFKDDLFAELDNFGKQLGNSADKNNKVVAQTPKNNH